MEVTTAVREAWRLHGEEVRAVSFSVKEGFDLTEVLEPPDPRDPQMMHLELREAFDLLAQVPERRRGVKALHVLGFKYEEIAEMLGLGYTNVISGRRRQRRGAGGLRR